ncbi:MAG: glycosyl transferase family 2 [Firmicutes bacterium]|nr:glycosyl transferase family 2 [Bacillota bacterium]
MTIVYSTPKVSICIPSYNSARTICETIDSVLQQSFTNFELLIVDNASTDETVDIVNRYMAKDSRVKLYTSEENIGAERNFTKCIQYATGEYTAVYNSDDVYLKDMVEKQVLFLENNKEVAAIFTLAQNIDENGKLGRIRRIPSELTKTGKNGYCFMEIFKGLLKYSNFITTPSAMVRTKVFKGDIQKSNCDLYASSADLEVWLRIAEKYPIGIINEVLMKYRISTNSFSYHYARRRTERHDLFLVLSAYVEKYRSCLDENDLKNYDQLLLKDDISRAINYVLRDERLQARSILKSAIKLDRVLFCFGWKKHMLIVVFGLITFMLTYTILPETIRKKIYEARYHI